MLPYLSKYNTQKFASYSFWKWTRSWAHGDWDLPQQCRASMFHDCARYNWHSTWKGISRLHHIFVCYSGLLTEVHDCCFCGNRSNMHPTCKRWWSGMLKGMGRIPTQCDKSNIHSQNYSCLKKSSRDAATSMWINRTECRNKTKPPGAKIYRYPMNISHIVTRGIKCSHSSRECGERHLSFIETLQFQIKL